MRPAVDAGNRAVLILLGLLLLAVGVLGLVLGGGGFGTERRNAPVLSESTTSFAAENPWFWWALAAACILISALALGWLLRQLHTERVGRIDLTTDERAGATIVHAGAVTDAVEDESRGIPGVADAAATLQGERRHRMALSVDVADYADIAEVRTHLEDIVVPRLRQALDDAALPVDIEIRPGRSGSADRNLV